jgi:tRNA(adenine34) deaminase
VVNRHQDSEKTQRGGDAEDGQHAPALVPESIAESEVEHGTYHCNDESFLRAAIELARKAEALGEVPIGAIVVVDGRIVGRGFNSPVSSCDPAAHAEIAALREAALALGNYRLDGATLYVTLEPCAMCAGAIVHARVKRLVYGARDLRFGAVRSKFRLADSEILNHQVDVVEGVLAAECTEILQAFFKKKR